MTTLAFWKPYGTLTKFTDAEGRQTLAEWIDVPDVYPAGRLDRDSEGLLILSDDPRLRGALTSSHHPRTYLVQVERTPSTETLERLAAGVEIRGRRTRPSAARAIDEPAWLGQRIPPIRSRREIPTAWIELTLTEGRNRQVRRMTAAVGHPTLRLVRWSIGPVTLEGLTPGTWREMPHPDVEELRGVLR